MFLKCSGVDGSDVGGEDGARVGDGASSASSGRAEGSKSRSGMRGDINGLFVILSRMRRKKALCRKVNASHMLTGKGSVLDKLNEYNAPPSRLHRDPPPQAHFDQQFKIADELERTGDPFVQGALLGPSAGVAGVERGRNEGAVLGVGLDKLGKERVVVHAHGVEQGGD